MDECARQLGVTAPTKEELTMILTELDDNSDGTIDKDEFHGLVLLVLGKMIELESEHEM